MTKPCKRIGVGAYLKRLVVAYSCRDYIEKTLNDLHEMTLASAIDRDDVKARMLAFNKRLSEFVRMGVPIDEIGDCLSKKVRQMEADRDFVAIKLADIWFELDAGAPWVPTPSWYHKWAFVGAAISVALSIAALIVSLLR